MRFAKLLPLFGLVVVGCTVKEYNGPPPASGTGAPATGVDPTTGATTPPPSSTVGGATTATPATPTPPPGGIMVAPTGGTPTTGSGGTVVSPGVAGGTPVAAAATMSKANAFGQPSPFAGAIPGTVYALPAGTMKLPTSWSSLTPITTLYSQSWNVSPRDYKEGFPGVPGDRVEWFAIRWEGTVHVVGAGKYHFKTSSDDGVKLYLDGALVVNNDGLHPPSIVEGDAQLTNGNHTMVIEYFQGPKFSLALQIWVSSPALTERILTSSF